MASPVNANNFKQPTFSDVVDSHNPYPAELPSGFKPFEEFQALFALGGASTEQSHPVTEKLSQAMHSDLVSGMELLLAADKDVLKGFSDFIPVIEAWTPILAKKIMSGGRIFLVGSGSSGRVAVDIAAKCNMKFQGESEQVIGVIAGGDSAVIRAKEGFEDSEADGEAALKEYNVGSNDVVVLISASGSASFNVGCGHFAANQGAQVCYFYNSMEIPSRTQRLFERPNNPVTPLRVVTGAQAIRGSTRLQGATAAQVCLGSLVVSSLYLSRQQNDLAKQYPSLLLENMRTGIGVIEQRLNEIARFVEIEKGVFSDPKANFRRLQDETGQGYVTFVALKNSMLGVLVDATETSPTFSTNPIRRAGEKHKKSAEFSAYLAEEENDETAWESLLGRKVRPTDVKETKLFTLSAGSEGENSFAKRPKGKGNFTIGVVKLKGWEPIPERLIQQIECAKEQKGYTGCIVLCTGKVHVGQVERLSDKTDALLVIEDVPSDPFELSETVLLKHVLNIISNSSMVLMGKTHGNQMIDVRASNNKLIDRCIRLIQEIWGEYYTDQVCTRKQLYYYVAHVSSLKKMYEEQGQYTPSVVKIVLAMLALKKTPKDFQEVIGVLKEKEERVDWIGLVTV